MQRNKGVPGLGTPLFVSTFNVFCRKHDGDITNQIKISESVNTSLVGSFSLAYKVSDSSGNTSEIYRSVKVVDRTAPKITLKGEHTISIEVGGTNIEPGASAIDNYDGDISKTIVVTGAVDTAKTGTYIIRYNVTDSSPLGLEGDFEHFLQ